jgi:hypothetical protein
MVIFFHTKKGTFSIICRNKRWRVLCGDEDLGGYISAEQALDDLVGGHTYAPSNDADTAALGLPHELREWQRNK